MPRNGQPVLPLGVRGRALALYLAVLVLAYLAGSYLGALFLGLFYLVLFMPLLSLVHLAVTASHIRYHQSFSTEHPVKNEGVVYRLEVANESILPMPAVTVRFKQVHPFMEELMPDFTSLLRARGRLSRSYSLRCPFRGIYTVGLEAVEVPDLLGLVRLRLSVYYRTFYVYPRVLQLASFPTAEVEGRQSALGASGGLLPDHSLFVQLRAYRRGESLRHLYWRKFAATGIPQIREYQSGSEPAVTLYLDSRRAPRRGSAGLAVEDASVEILVALVRFLLLQGVATHVRAPGRTVFSFSGAGIDDFDAFYRHTSELFFQDTGSPMRLYRHDLASGMLAPSAVLVISHLMDPELFTVLEESLQSREPVSLVFNHSGYPPLARRRNRRYFNLLRDRGARIVEVEDTRSIVEDLEGRPRG